MAAGWWRNKKMSRVFLHGYGERGPAAGGAIVFLAFFSFAKQAFCNYYFMILGVICCAVAAIRPRPTSLK